MRPSCSRNTLAGIDVAANTQHVAYGPQPIASYTFTSDNAWNGIDGLVFRVGISEDTRWTSYASTNASDYYGVNFQRNVTFDYVWLNFYDDSGGVLVPASYDLQYWTNGAWASVPNQTRTPDPPVGNARTQISFPPVTTSQLRLVAPNAGASVGWGLSELWVRSRPIFNIVNVNSNLLLAMERRIAKRRRPSAAVPQLRHARSALGARPRGERRLRDREYQ